MVFVHDGIDENLSATFIRRDIKLHPIPDRRLADLGQTFSEADVIGYSVEWTPLSENGQFAWPIVGFFDQSMNLSSYVRMRNSFELGYNYRLGNPDGTENLLWNFGFPDWMFGTTYRIDFTLDGPNNSITFAASEFVGGEFQFIDSFQSAFAPTATTFTLRPARCLAGAGDVALHWLHTRWDN